MAKQAGDLGLQGFVDTSLMNYYRAHVQPEVAIFFGKLAVNAIQSIRSDMRGLSREVQKGFLRANETPYHILVELLIEEGRLAEAEQVVNLLKDEEYSEFVRRDSGEPSPVTQHADLTPDEAA